MEPKNLNVAFSYQNGQFGADRLPADGQGLPLGLATNQLESHLQEQQARLHHVHAQAFNVSSDVTVIYTSHVQLAHQLTFSEA